MIHTQIQKENKRLETQITHLETQLQSFPKGKLFCTTHGKYSKWYHSTKEGCTYIPKKERHFAEQLALKKLFLLQLKDAKQKKKALDFYLGHYSTKYQEAILALFEQREYSELLLPHFKPLSRELADWASAKYETNLSYPEQLQYKTSSGIYVRSKSEAIIDLLLHTHNIPHRYECKLILDNHTFFPDFTIRHPLTGNTYYWEHFGLMDDPGYRKNAMVKLQTYASHGIFPTINLITTYETKNSPLNTEYVKLLISHYFQ